ncbi:3-oxoacyl-[acyl-carrier-protein] synthase, KASIII [Candidatus Syntrophocurvum alkaliphilum]|uniref:Beta-ketoacyl-[acyl-carrier-protein] synthase III n=1 Tax=Candidatus Syntrophocurvum alkaliphilum TaxID=2293317 RepID=A0A6I6D5S1_9FIRM|nr:beta-ketoacyl-ACP synthase III [Candidatus Syntrophocurvum alkaliphilum]QGT98716.1 3-oxoacyl-[acyl-carrier-protein] synthase, KASIII [Candidatus Syntrophocurvum alkaliphilum]
MGAEILGIGYHLPDKILNNKDLEKMLDTSESWIVERTGIHERRIADDNQATSDLAFLAAQNALSKANVDPMQLDLIICATATPDKLFPSTACILQDRLGASNAAAFDLSAACTGFIYALTVAEKFLSSPDHSYILIIGAEALSKVLDYTERNVSILFGDGAGAAVIGKSKGTDDNSILQSYIGSDGSGHGLLHLPAGGSALPASNETINDRLHYMKMNGNEVFRFATKVMVDVSTKLLDMANLKPEQVDLFIPHQANIRIIKTAMKRINIPEHKTFINIDRCANMSAASIPVALAEAEERQLIKKGDILLLVGFGAGLTYGGTLLRWRGN